MNFLSAQEMHNLAMKIVGDQLKKSGYEFLSVNSKLKKDPQFVCLKDKKVFFVIIRAVRFPNNPDYFNLDNFKKIIEHAKGFKAKISLDQGIAELIQIFSKDKNKIINKY